MMLVKCLFRPCCLSLIVVGLLLVQPRQVAASTVNLNLRAELKVELLEFSLLSGGGVSVPAFDRDPPAGTVVSQLWLDASQAPVSTEFLEANDFSVPLTAFTGNAVGFARASQEVGWLEAQASFRADRTASGQLSLSAGAWRSFDMVLHGVGTLLATVPFTLEAKLDGPETNREMFGYASVGISATRRQPGAGTGSPAIDYYSGAALQMDPNRRGSPSPFSELLTIAIPFNEGDRVSLFLSAGATSYLDAQLVPLPAGLAPFATGVVVLAARSVRSRTATGSSRVH